MPRRAAITLLAVLLTTSWLSAQELPLPSLAAALQSSPTSIGAGLHADTEFTLAPGYAAPVYLYFEALQRYPHVSRTGGILRVTLNGVTLTAQQSVNRAKEYSATALRGWAAEAFCLPARPDFPTPAPTDPTGFGYLFDITRIVRERRNTLRFSHVATGQEVLIRNLGLMVGGQPTKLALSAAVGDLNDPKLLTWNFAPNIVEKKGLFLCQDSLQAVGFYINNEDQVAVYALGLVLDLPRGVELFSPHTLCGGNAWSTRIRVAQQPVKRSGRDYRQYTLTFPEEIRVPARSGWYDFGCLRFQLYLRCRAPAGDYRLYWHSLSQSGAGAEQSAPLTVLPPLPVAPQPQRSKLGVWAYRAVANSTVASEQELETVLREELMAQLARAGVSRIVLRFPDEIPAARRHGLLPSLASMWSGDTVYPTAATDDAKACLDGKLQARPLLNRPNQYLWCPTYAADHVAEVYGPITERLRTEDWGGFDLDHEGNHPECFCERCRQLFCDRAKLDAQTVHWPADVVEGGPLRDRWVEFHLWNTGRYVQSIRQAVKAANPDTPLFCYFLPSLYDRDFTGPHAETYRQRRAAERAEGYDANQFLPYVDYANMANSVYPQGEQTWTDPYGLPWAIGRIEATVANPWRTPLAPCFNFSEHTWTDHRYLRWQLKTHLVQGIRGLDFYWLLSLDGRYFALMSQMARLFAASEPFLWDGQRCDVDLKVQAPAEVTWHAWRSGERTFFGATNRSLQTISITVAPPPGQGRGTDVLSGHRIGARLTLPALDGVFVIYRR